MSSSHRVRKIPKALTGTSTRMKTLPIAEITSLEYHKCKPQSFVSSLKTQASLDNEEANMDTIDSSDKSLTRKCVYTYEDKYTFARILLSDSFVFDSHFESGNLHSAFRVFIGDEKNLRFTPIHTYDLYMHNDIYTNGHTQWFYFSVTNVKVGHKVTFNIKNFSKPDSLFNEGMKPLLLSLKSGLGWVRCGSDVSYHVSNNINDFNNNNNPKDGSKKKSQSGMYTVTFTHTFDKDDDKCYFSYCHPYTYTDLQRHLFLCQSNNKINSNFRRTTLCRTIGGNLCDLLTITSPCKSPNELNNKVYVILTARVHPGESNASWIMQGMIDFLISNHDDAIALREKFVFKIIPMLNPDGVINGNYRTSLSGQDLNRTWNKPDPIKHPTIFHTKELIIRLSKLRVIGLAIDIHGHSRKQGVFLYSCIPDKKILRPHSPPINIDKESPLNSRPTTSSENNFPLFNPNIIDASNLNFGIIGTEKEIINTNIDIDKEDVTINNERRFSLLNSIPEYEEGYFNFTALPSRRTSFRDVVAWRVRLFPRILEKISSYFTYSNCNFKMQKSKVSTMRLVAFTELGIECAYTLEASLGGKEPQHYSVHDLQALGKDVCLGILISWPSMSRENLTLDKTKNYLSNISNNIIKQDGYMNEEEINLQSSQLNPPELFEEIFMWKQYYSVEDKRMGVSLLSESGLYEMTNGGNNGNLITDSSDVANSDSVTPSPIPWTSTVTTVKNSSKDKIINETNKKGKEKKKIKIKENVIEKNMNKEKKQVGDSVSSNTGDKISIRLDGKVVSLNNAVINTMPIKKNEKKIIKNNDDNNDNSNFTTGGLIKNKELRLVRPKIGSFNHDLPLNNDIGEESKKPSLSINKISRINNSSLNVDKKYMKNNESGSTKTVLFESNTDINIDKISKDIINFKNDINQQRPSSQPISPSRKPLYGAYHEKSEIVMNKSIAVSVPIPPSRPLLSSQFTLNLSRSSYSNTTNNNNNNNNFSIPSNNASANYNNINIVNSTKSSYNILNDGCDNSSDNIQRQNSTNNVITNSTAVNLIPQSKYYIRQAVSPSLSIGSISNKEFNNLDLETTNSSHVIKLLPRRIRSIEDSNRNNIDLNLG